jgi:hypothetical protein
MSGVNRIKTFLSLDFKSKILMFETFFYLGCARIIKILPLTKLGPLLGTYMKDTSFTRNYSGNSTVKNISSAINIISRYTFWESNCLVRAIAAMKMLERRKIESTLYLGMAKDENGNLLAHAWLRSGDFFVTGAEEMQRFTVVGKFAKNTGYNNEGEMIGK